MKSRNAQAALEYLFTYGWAFLLIIVTTGALLYFGVFDIDRLRGSDCVFPAGVLCEDFYVGPGLDDPTQPEVRIILRNSYGVDVDIDLMGLTGDLSGDQDCVVDSSSFPYLWERDQEVEFICPLDEFLYVRGQRYDITFIGSFRQGGHSYVHELRGWLSTNAQ